MLCFCLGFTYDEVEKIILEGDYPTIAAFQNDTFIGEGCGRCLPVVYDLFKRKDQD